MHKPRATEDLAQEYNQQFAFYRNYVFNNKIKHFTSRVTHVSKQISKLRAKLSQAIGLEKPVQE